MMLTAWSDFLFLFLLITLGSLASRIIVAEAGNLEILSLGLPMGTGIFTVMIFWLSWAGISITAGLLWLVLVVLLLFCLLLKKPSDLISLTRSQRFRLHLPPAGFSPSSIFLILGVGIFVILAAWKALVISYGSWDAAAIWAAKGYGISLEKTIFAAESWGAHGLSYPLNLPLAISVFKTLSGDVLPSSKLLFPLFFGSASLGLASRAIARGAERWLVTGTTLLLVSTPIIFRHGYIGYVNLSFSTYLILGVLWGIEALSEGQKGSFLVSGLLLAFATWTRPEGVSYLFLLIPGMIILNRFLTKGPIQWWHWISPTLIIYGSWFALSRQHMVNGSIGGYVTTFIKSVGRGQFNLFELYLIPRLFLDRALDPRIWGVLFPVAGIIFLISIWVYSPKKFPVHFFEVILAPLIASVPVLLFYIQSFTISSQYITVLNRSFDRAFFPAAMMLAYLVMRTFPGVDDQFPANSQSTEP